jgi:hypothetical protein
MLNQSVARYSLVSSGLGKTKPTYKPYCVSKTYGTPPNDRYRIPRMRALHISRKRTINCVVSRTDDQLAWRLVRDAKAY